MLGLTIWMLPWYTLAFALLAFLPRWQFLIPGGVLAILFSIYQFRALAHEGSPGALTGLIIMAFLSVGFASGFLARAIALAGAARSRYLSPKFVIPVLYLTGIICFLSYTGVG